MNRQCTRLDQLLSRRGETLLDQLRRRGVATHRSEEHTSELQSRQYLVCRLLLEKKKNIPYPCFCVCVFFSFTLPFVVSPSATLHPPRRVSDRDVFFCFLFLFYPPSHFSLHCVVS